MALPSDFHFSQAVLQDYLDCPRRFQLRHVRRVAWPAVESEPFLDHERRLLQGSAFHRLVWQHLSGIDADRLSLAGRDPDLQRWWQNYRATSPANLPGRLYPEVTLGANVAGFRLVAKYDLLALDPAGDTVIVDWKTGHSRTPDEVLPARMQTVVYRYLLVRAGTHLNYGQAIDPDRVRMTYWFAEHPSRPALLPYSRQRFAADGTYLNGLIHAIDTLGDDDFLPSADERACRYCWYRSLCGRGEQPASGLDEDDDSSPEEAFALDFDQVAEIEF